MPWTPADAPQKTDKATTLKRKRQWADVADSVLRRTGDEGRAVRTANGILKRAASK